mmetsp:Transcript_155826/g.283441  ORF Transcript_155826/g.283441 Transcript_155826/m.283441 type:complete len:565 (+) Transcript_155826:119-1813(+)
MRTCCQGIPVGQMLLLCSALFASSIGITFVFPFLPFQVGFFHVGVSEIGYYAGIVGSSYMIGRASSSVPWGIIADRHGRKRVLVLSMYLMAAATLVYGLAPTFSMAVLARFACGASNGILGPGKSLASEICEQDEQTQATAMTMVMTAFNLGSIVGPAVGGWLAEPATKYPFHFSETGLFGRMPFLLPALAVVVGILVCGVLVHLHLQESLSADDESKDAIGAVAKRKQVKVCPGERQHKSDISRGKHIKKHAIYLSVAEEEKESPGTPASESVKEQVFATPYGAPAEHSDDDCDRSSGEVSGEGQPETAPQPCEQPQLPSPQNKGRVRLLMEDPLLALVVLLYCVLSFVDFITHEVLPLWATASIANGGLAWDSSQVGSLIGVVAAATLVLQLLIYPPLVGCIGMLPLYRICILGVMLACFFTPWLPVVTGHAAPVIWPALILTRGLQEFFKQSLFIASFGFVNNSTTIQQRGLVNGVAISLASLTKALGPVVGGSVFAWTVSSNMKYPFNIHGPWILISIIYFIMFVLSLRLPQDIVRAKESVSLDGGVEPDLKEHKENDEA